MKLHFALLFFIIFFYFFCNGSNYSLMRPKIDLHTRRITHQVYPLLETLLEKLFQSELMNTECPVNAWITSLKTSETFFQIGAIFINNHIFEL